MKESSQLLPQGSMKADAIDVSIVVPTYREADNLFPLVERIGHAMADTQYAYEIIIVDDASPDDTPEVVAKLSSMGYPLCLIVRRDERGLASAVIRGFEEARGNMLVCMDADLSHPPEAIPKLIAALGEANPAPVEDALRPDFVIGSRYVPGGGMDEDWGFLRWLNSRVATLLARPFTNARDPMAGFFALCRATYQSAAPLDPIGYKIGLELIVKCRCRHVSEIPIQFADRHAGESKLNLREQLRYLRHLTRLARFKLRDRS